MDEVHYLADRMRGAVWEEVIIHLPESVARGLARATVSNAEEFGEWLEHRARRDHDDRRGEAAGPALPARHGRPPADRPVRRPPTSTRPPGSSEGARSTHELLAVARDDWASTRHATGARHAGAGRENRRARRQRPPRCGSRPASTSSTSSTEGAAPGDLLHLQPGRVRRRGAAVPATHLRLTTPEERARSGSSSRSAARTSPTRTCTSSATTTSSTGSSRGVAAHHAGMLPTFKECVEELFVRGLVQGRVRHRDAGAGHQHAGPVGGHREAGEVERRDARRHHAGGVHPAHRPRRPARHRRRGPRRRALEPGHGPEGGRRAGVDPDLPAPVVASGRRTTWRSTSCTSSAGTGARAAGVVLRAVPGGPGGRRARPAAAQGRGGARGVRRGGDLPPRRLHGVLRACAGGSATSRGRRLVPGGPTGATRSSLARALRPGDVIEVPTGKYAGLAVVHRPRHASTGDEPRPYVLTADRQARRLSMVDFPTPVEALTRMKVPRNFNGRNAQSRRELASPAAQDHDRRPPPRGGPDGQQGRTRTADDRDRRAARRAAGAPVPRLRGPRVPRPLGRALVKLDRDTADTRAGASSRGPTRWRGSSTASATCSLPRLPRRRARQGHRAGSHLMRIYTDMRPGRRRVPARGPVGRPVAGRPRRRAVGARLRGPPRRRRHVAPDAGGRGARGHRRDGGGSGARSTGSRTTTGSTSCASPTWASPGRRTAGPRATTSTRCSTGPTWPPATSCAG